MRVFDAAVIQPDSVLAGDSAEFSIRLTVGPDYTRNASRIVFDFSCTLGTSAPTRMINEASGFVEAYCDNPEITWRLRCWDLDYRYFIDRAHPPSREAARMAVLDLSSGMQRGDVIELHWGETTGGFGPGTKVSSVVPRPNYKARVDVRYFDSQDKGMPDYGRDYDGYRRPVPDAGTLLEYAILPRAPRRLRLIRKTDKAFLVPLDMFWNVAALDDAAQLAGTVDPPVRNPQGVFEYSDKNIQIRHKTLPVTATPAMDGVYEGMNIYWGDLHTHSCYSKDCSQRSGMDMRPRDLMDFAKSRAGLDFFAVTDHHVPARDPSCHLGQAAWDATLDDMAARHADGEFAVFAGIELTDNYGDICIIFRNPPAYAALNRPSLAEASDFVKQMPETDLMVIPHFHSPGKKPENTWRAGIESVCPVMEIFSDHGSYECEDALESGRAEGKQFRRDRCGRYFLQNGYKYGFVANSDDHKGHAGVNGLTAVFAPELTREALLAAYRRRNVYGTTNARFRLVFTANGKLMGSIQPNCSAKEFFISIIGEHKLKKVELFRQGGLYRSFFPDDLKFETGLTIKDPAPGNWYVRATQIDNHVAWSSPVWFE